MVEQLLSELRYDAARKLIIDRHSAQHNPGKTQPPLSQEDARLTRQSSTRKSILTSAPGNPTLTELKNRDPSASSANHNAPDERLTMADNAKLLNKDDFTEVINNNKQRSRRLKRLPLARETHKIIDME